MTAPLVAAAFQGLMLAALAVMVLGVLAILTAEILEQVRDAWRDSQ